MNNIKINYKCPLCNCVLNKGNNIYKCENNHSFDISKFGYVNLLLANQKKSASPGDDKDMVVGRKLFLDKGYYLPLKQQVESVIKSLCVKNILDAGCGTGYYSSNLVNVWGIDISKYAVEYAARANKQNSYAVASIFNLPFEDSCFDLCLNIFAPKPENEFARVLKNGGYILEITPTDNHLIEIKNLIYDNVKNTNANNHFLEYFKLESQSVVEYKASFERVDDYNNLVKMTPFYQTQKNRVVNTFVQNITFSFNIKLFKKIK